MALLCIVGCGRLIINLDAQEYKDILSTIDLYKEGVTVTHSTTGAPGEPDYRKEENVYINNEKCLWAVTDEDENGIRSDLPLHRCSAQD